MKHIALNRDRNLRPETHTSHAGFPHQLSLGKTFDCCHGGTNFTRHVKINTEINIAYYGSSKLAFSPIFHVFSKTFF